MAKKSRKRPLRSKSANAGCMWGLISMFDFRHGHSTQKLLSDKKHGSGRYGGSGLSRSTFDLLTNLEEKHKDAHDIDANLVAVDNLRMVSIKTLIEEEMSSAAHANKTHSLKVDQMRSELGSGANLENNHTQAISTFEVGADHHSNSQTSARAASCQASCPNLSKNFDVNLAELMVEFCCDNHQCQERHINDKSEINSCPPEIIDFRKPNFLNDDEPRLDQKHLILQKALRDLIKAFLTHESANSNPHTDKDIVHQSKELMDVLETVNLNKELLLQLLQDPDSLLLKNIEDLLNSQNGKCLDGNEFVKEIPTSGQQEKTGSNNNILKHTGHQFFRRKDKSKGIKQSNENDDSVALNRIVVLKPSPPKDQHLSNMISPCSSPQSQYSFKNKENTGSLASHFSLTEIKRRLKHVIGGSRKERHQITMDGLLHKIPYGFRFSGDNGKISCSTDDTFQIAPFSKRGDKKANLKEHKSQEVNKTTIAEPSCRESVFYDKARKHLAEVLNSDGKTEIQPTRETSKSLGRMLSLPEYDLLSPRFSPRKEPLSPRQMRFSPLWHIKQEDGTNLSPSKQMIESSPSSNSNQDDRLQTLDSDPALVNSQLQIGEDLINECMEMQQCDHVDVPSEVNADGPRSTSRRDEEEVSSMLSGLGPSEQPQPECPSISISPNSLFIRKLEGPESTIENPGRPSPVSVLDFFPEDVISFDSTATEHCELSAQPRYCHFEHEDYEDSPPVLTSAESEVNLQISCMEENQAELEYVRTVLEASGLSLNIYPDGWHSLDQFFLDPSLFDGVEISQDRLKDNQKLLFDCISEVLMEIQERHFSCTPWVSFIKPNTRTVVLRGNVTQEVCKGIDKHLRAQFPCTLDQQVRKDMDGDSWMDLQRENESTVSEVGESILGYLMEETILELWD